MNIRKALIMKIFDASYMQRWNDKLRPMELTELDKQAHKMIIAYLLGKFEEKKNKLDWIEIIKGGFFELLQRVIITDIKPPIFYKIKKDPKRYEELKNYVAKELEVYLKPFDSRIFEDFQNYFAAEENTTAKKILAAAHNYASRWEFNIIECINPGGYEIAEISREFDTRIEKYNELEGTKEIASHVRYKSFVNLCGDLRFQIRWSHRHRIPKTSVLGHSLFVAILSFLFSIKINACPKRIYNNFFTGLFHDLPEVLTRDIISPIKKNIKGLDTLLKQIEKEELEEKVYPLIPSWILDEFKMFTEKEFENFVTIDGKKTKKSCDEINEKFNTDIYNPRDGELVKAADELAAFIEAYAAVENGCVNLEFQEAMTRVRSTYRDEKPKIAGLCFKEIYADF